MRTGQNRITRRTWLRGALVGTATAASQPVVGQALQTHLPPGAQPRPKGPRVFLDYDQAELDAAYEQDNWAPNRAHVAARTARRNAVARARLGAPRRLAYGNGDAERLDLYPASRSQAPVQVFIHGGAWRAGSAAQVAYLAESFVDRGAHFIALDFNNVLETDGELAVLARQVRQAIAWVYRNAASFGGDPNRLFMSGFSSGAHLAAVVLTTDWPGELKVPTDVIKGATCCSGMYDLHPVSLSARSRYVKFTPEVVEALSPQRHIRALSAALTVAHGTLETPEFQRQARAFADAVRHAGRTVTLVVGEGYNHFEMQETLADPYGLVGRAVLQQMGLT